MNKELTAFDYMKLLLANVIIAFVIAIAAVGFVYADGVDDPNFYKDFNPDHPDKKYEFFAPPEWKKKQNYNIVPLPDHECSYHWQKCNYVNVPEPTELLLLTSGIISMCVYRRFTKKPD